MPVPISSQTQALLDAFNATDLSKKIGVDLSVPPPLPSFRGGHDKMPVTSDPGDEIQGTDITDTGDDPQPVDEQQTVTGPSEKPTNSVDDVARQLTHAIGMWEWRDKTGPATYKRVNGIGAMGRYQFMPGTLKSVSEKYLGRSVGRQEFLNNPQLQDQLAFYMTKEHLERNLANTGDINKAAQLTAIDHYGHNGGKLNSPAMHKGVVVGESPMNYAANVLKRMNGTVDVADNAPAQEAPPESDEFGPLYLPSDGPPSSVTPSNPTKKSDTTGYLEAMVRSDLSAQGHQMDNNAELGMRQNELADQAFRDAHPTLTSYYSEPLKDIIGINQDAQRNASPSGLAQNEEYTAPQMPNGEGPDLRYIRTRPKTNLTDARSSISNIDMKPGQSLGSKHDEEVVDSMIKKSNESDAPGFIKETANALLGSLPSDVAIGLTHAAGAFIEPVAEVKQAVGLDDHALEDYRKTMSTIASSSGVADKIGDITGQTLKTLGSIETLGALGFGTAASMAIPTLAGDLLDYDAGEREVTPGNLLKTLGKTAVSAIAGKGFEVVGEEFAGLGEKVFTDAGANPIVGNWLGRVAGQAAVGDLQTQAEGAIEGHDPSLEERVTGALSLGVLSAMHARPALEAARGRVESGGPEPDTHPLDGTPHEPYAPGGYKTEEPLINHPIQNGPNAGTNVRGVIARDIDIKQAREIDPYAFKKEDGIFIHEKHVSRPDGFTEQDPHQVHEQVKADLAKEREANAQAPTPEPDAPREPLAQKPGDEVTIAGGIKGKVTEIIDNEGEPTHYTVRGEDGGVYRVDDTGEINKTIVEPAATEAATRPPVKHQVGDVVNVVDHNGDLVTPEPRKIAEIVDDPKHADEPYVRLEGSTSFVPQSRVELVGEKGQDTAVVEAPNSLKTTAPADAASEEALADPATKPVGVNESLGKLGEEAPVTEDLTQSIKPNAAPDVVPGPRPVKPTTKDIDAESEKHGARVDAEKRAKIAEEKAAREALLRSPKSWIDVAWQRIKESKAAKWAQKKYVPQTASDGARKTALDWRANSAKYRNDQSISLEALREARGKAARMTSAQAIAFMERAQKGDPQKGWKVVDSEGKVVVDVSDVEAQKIQEITDHLFNSSLEKMHDLNVGAMQTYYEHYFPQFWEQTSGVKDVAAQMGERGSILGDKGFMKQRTYEDVLAGHEAGLTLVSYNPIDVALLRLATMNKYIRGQRNINDSFKRKSPIMVLVGRDAPEGYRVPSDPAFTVYGSNKIETADYVDAELWDNLRAFANLLGVNPTREKNVRVNGKSEGILGVARMDSGMTPDDAKGARIETKQGTGTNVLAHEIGHVVERQYNVHDKITAGRPDIVKQLQELGLRRDYGDGETDTQYLTNKDEVIANLVDAYIHAPDLLNEVAPDAKAAFDKFLDETPRLRVLKDIKPSVTLKGIAREESVVGSVTRGHYAVPEAEAQVWDNITSRGLRDNPWFEMVRAYNNTASMSKLSFSAFHMMETSLNSIVNDVGLGVREILKGNGARGMKLLTSSLNIRMKLREGSAIIHAATHPNEPGSELWNEVIKTALEGGASFSRDKYYDSGFREKFQKSWEANSLKAIPQGVGAMFEFTTKKIMEQFVPKIKAYAVATMVQDIMTAQKEPVTDPYQMRQMVANAVDHADNIFGQLIYSNLFWDNLHKDVWMQTFLSTGWNFGTARAFYGGTSDLYKSALAKKNGGNFDLTHRSAYLISLVATHALINGILTTLLSGQLPDSMMDFMYAKTGDVDDLGRPRRLQVKDYVSDVYGLTKDPIGTLTGKLSPALNLIAALVENKMHYGEEIYSPEASLFSQLKDIAWYAATDAYVPFTASTIYKEIKEGTKNVPGLIALNAAGIKVARKELYQSKAEALQDSYSRQRYTEKRSPEEVARTKYKGQVMARLKSGDELSARALSNELIDAGKLTHADVDAVYRDKDVPGIVRHAKGDSPDQIMNVYALEDKVGKDALWPEIEKKIAGRDEDNTLPEDLDEMYKRYSRLRDERTPPRTGATRGLKAP